MVTRLTKKIVHLNVLNSGIFFKSEELAQKAIEILGEETIKQALSVDY